MTTVAAAKSRERGVLQSPTARLAVGIALSALSGLMFLLAFPPYGLWPLAWFGFVPALIAQYRVMPAKWSSLASAIFSGVWLGPFLGRLFGSGFGPFFQFLGVWIAILNFFVSRDRKFHDLTHYRWFILQGVLAWVGLEMVRATFIPLVATSAFIGYTQAPQPWLIQPVSVFSVYGLNLIIMLCNYALAQGAMAWLDRAWHADAVQVETPSTRRWLIGVGAALALWVALSLVLLSGVADQPKVRVAALRPNYALPAFQDELNTSQIRFEGFAAQAREAAAHGARILYTTEMIFNLDPQQEFTEEFRALARETGAYIFITYTVSKEGEPWRNEAVLLTPTGEFQAVYGKNHAFGEPVTALKGVYPVYDTPLGRLATLICHDGNYTDVARKLVANGAQIIAAPYGEFAGFGEQAWTNVLFRAVENRTAAVMTGVETISAIINPDGSLVALDMDIKGSTLTLVGDVTVGSGPTLYTSLGDILGWVSLVGFVGFMIFQNMIEGRAKKAAKQLVLGGAQ